jgi:acyl-CoA dehydrogenase
MDLNDLPEHAVFRAQARDWLAAHAPRFAPAPDACDADLVKLLKAWQAVKADAGYVGFTVAKQHGGRGASFIEEVIFCAEELRHAIAQVPLPYMTIGVGNAVPVMLTHATPALIDQLLRPTLRGDLLWAQLFSEPAAGSDVAGIRTRAIRDGNDWVINGQKVWSSGAHVADWAMLIARSDPEQPKHKGITFFFLDMKTPGIEIRPLKQITGRSEFNEVFFTDVRIPDHYRIGAINGGWQVIVTTLLNERFGSMTTSASAFGGNVLDPLLQLAQQTPGVHGGSALQDDQHVRARLADYIVTLCGIRYTLARLTTGIAHGAQPGPEGAITKLLATRWLQDMATFGLDVAGPAGAISDSRLSAPLQALQDSFLGSVGYRQGGGTEDINKNIIAERILGLPADPRNDKDLPFSQLAAAHARKSQARA